MCVCVCFNRKTNEKNEEKKSIERELLATIKVSQIFFLKTPVLTHTHTHMHTRGGPWCRLSSEEIDTATRVQILDDDNCISQSTDTPGKGMNPIILPPAMDKIAGQTRLFSLGEATCLREGKL